MRQYMSRRKEFLNIILSSEAMKGLQMCSWCSESGSWCCLDCLGQPVYCMGCCRDAHEKMVFHRVEHWMGSYWEPAWLRQTGVSIHLGHRGSECPPMEFVHATDHQDVPENATDPEASWMNTAEDEDEYDGENPFQDVDNESLPSIFSRDQFPKAGTLDSTGCPNIVIIDRSGLHHIGVHFCECEGAQSKDIQLLQMGLYPSSFDQPRTSFTFQVLDDFLMDTLECKTTGSNSYSKTLRIQ